MIILRILQCIFHFICGVILLFSVPFVWPVTLRLIHHVTERGLWWPMLWGILPGLLLAAWAITKHGGYWLTLEHEITSLPHRAVGVTGLSA